MGTTMSGSSGLKDSVSELRDEHRILKKLMARDCDEIEEIRVALQRIMNENFLLKEKLGQDCHYNYNLDIEMNEEKSKGARNINKRLQSVEEAVGLIRQEMNAMKTKVDILIHRGCACQQPSCVQETAQSDRSVEHKTSPGSKPASATLTPQISSSTFNVLETSRTSGSSSNSALPAPAVEQTLQVQEIPTSVSSSSPGTTTLLDQESLLTLSVEELKTPASNSTLPNGELLQVDTSVSCDVNEAEREELTVQSRFNLGRWHCTLPSGQPSRIEGYDRLWTTSDHMDPLTGIYTVPTTDTFHFEVGVSDKYGLNWFLCRSKRYNSNNSTNRSDADDVIVLRDDLADEFHRGSDGWFYVKQEYDCEEGDRVWVEEMNVGRLRHVDVEFRGTLKH